MGSEIHAVCKKKEVCPYELVKAALSDAEVIALSYLYVFDPAHSHALSSKTLKLNSQKIILIVDEAHNLPETAIDISSSNLSLFVMRQAEMEAERFGNKDIEDFAHFFRDEVEKITDKISREEIISPDSIIEIIEKQGSIANPENSSSTCMKQASPSKKRLLG